MKRRTLGPNPKQVTLSFLLFLATLTWAAIPTSVRAQADDGDTATPIKHLVVIFQENVSFDHYFATYPFAKNPAGEPPFHARWGGQHPTPSVNNLLSGGLLSANPNSHNPFRLDRSQNYTCDQNHDYGPEQAAMNSGLLNNFVETVGGGAGSCPDYGFGKALTMGYYDGNTVTAIWNYVQHFAMSDNSYGTTFGPSTPGAINLVAGNTYGVDLAHSTGDLSEAVVNNTTVIGDPDPFYDDCSGSTTIAMTGTNVGDLLNAAKVTWGWFQGGFKPTAVTGGKAVCGASSVNLGGATVTDYSAHHEPFQYYASTANPHHLPPSSVAMIGKTDQANHQYDLADFWQAANSGHLPAVSFLKAKKAQDGHAGYSSPLDEQAFIVETLNALQKLSEWREMAVIIAYDDSDGWYDHVMPPIVSQSSTSADQLTGPGSCGPAVGVTQQGRCGYGPRLPFIVVSPWAKVNYVDHAVTDLSSILRFIEDNWRLGRIGNGSFDEKAGSLSGMFDFSRRPFARRLFLNPSSGEMVWGDNDER